MIKIGKLRYLKDYEEEKLLPVLLKRMDKYTTDESVLYTHLLLKLAPSDSLLDDYESGHISFKEFKKLYFNELDENKEKTVKILDGLDKSNRAILISENLSGCMEPNYPEVLMKWLKAQGFKSEEYLVNQ